MARPKTKSAPERPVRPVLEVRDDTRPCQPKHCIAMHLRADGVLMCMASARHGPEWRCGK